MECKFCRRAINNAGSLKAHENCCGNNPNRVKRVRSPNAGAKKGCTPWNKGAPGIQKHSNKKKKLLSQLGTDRRQTEETKAKLSAIAKENGYGGYKPGSGRGKSGWYKGIWCDSSWELAYVIYCIDHNIPIRRCNEQRTYTWENKTLGYRPDFVVDGEIIEIKGYKTPQWLAKLDANKDIKVLYGGDLKPILSYVKETYGRDFVKLLEGARMDEELVSKTSGR